MKLNSPIPQSLSKECVKAARIFESFVDGGNNGLDGVIPRSVLQNAKGFAIFTIFKAGFLFSARAGSGVVIARLGDGRWSAPSAMGTAGLGVGTQLGAEMTDFLIVLNTRSAIQSFMAAGSLTLGGNLSLAMGPLGRNGEAIGSLNTSGKVAAMYSYSKTRGLFGGISLEGSVIMERQDANALAYKSPVTARMLLGGIVDSPEWALSLEDTLTRCTGAPTSTKWVQDGHTDGIYAFGGFANPNTDPQNKKRDRRRSSVPPTSWNKPEPQFITADEQLSTNEHTSSHLRAHSNLETSASRYSYSDSAVGPSHDSHNPARHFHPRAYNSSPVTAYSNHGVASSIVSFEERAFPHVRSNSGLTGPFDLREGVAHAIALYDFEAIEDGDLPFRKGDIIIVTKKSDSNNDWWTGKIGSKRGIFPANRVEVV